MGSGLAVTWLPAFDGGLWQADRHATLTYSRLGDLLDGIPQPALDQLHVVYQRGDPDASTIDDMLDSVRPRWIGQFITAINRSAVASTRSLMRSRSSKSPPPLNGSS